MRLYFDLDLGRLVSKPGFTTLLTQVEFKRGDMVRLEVAFYRGSVPAAVAGTPSEMVFVVKKLAAGEALMLADNWTSSELGTVWSASLVSDSENLDTELGSALFKDLSAEFTFTDDNGGPTSSQTITAKVINDLWKGTEGTPLELPTPLDWLVANVEAALEGKTIEVSSIGLANTGSEALDPGESERALGLNSSNQLVLHTGDSNGDDLPYLVDSKRVINFAAFVPPVLMDNVTYSRFLAEIPLTAAEVANGKYLHLIGLLQTVFPNGGMKPDIGIYLVICSDGQDPATEGIAVQIGEGDKSEERSFAMSFSFSVSGSAWTLATIYGSVGQCILRKNASGVITHGQGWVLGGDYFEALAPTGPVGSPTKLKLYLMSLDTSDAVTAGLLIAGNFSAITQ